MRNLVQFAQLNSLNCVQLSALTLTLSQYPIPSMVFYFGFSIWVFFFHFVWNYASHSWTLRMQNQSLSAQICSVGQGRIYLVHLQLARGVVKGVFVERGVLSRWDRRSPAVRPMPTDNVASAELLWNEYKYLRISQGRHSAIDGWGQGGVSMGGNGGTWVTKWKPKCDGWSQPRNRMETPS